MNGTCFPSCRVLVSACVGATILLAASMVSAAPAPRISVDPTFGNTDTEFELRIAVDETPASALSEPVFQSNSEFSFRRGPTSSIRQSVNGNERYEVDFVVIAKPAADLKPGPHKIPDGRMIISGKAVELPGPQITIIADGNERRAEEDEQVKGLNFTHLVSDLNPYVGQQILYRAEMASSRPLQLASLNDIEPSGFLRESLGDERQREQRIGGTQRISIVEALFATKPGELEIPRRELMLQVAVPSRQRPRRLLPPGRFPRNPLDAQFERLEEQMLAGFMQTEIVQKKLVADSFRVNVRPLPDPKTQGLNNLPPGYVPVGSLTPSFRLSADAIKLGESVTLTLSLTGDANLRPYELPQPEGSFAKDFKLYPEKPELEAVPTRDGMHFTKTFKLSFVPQHAGALKIPAVQAVWFSPKEGRYVAFRVEGQTVNVVDEPGSHPAPAAVDFSQTGIAPSAGVTPEPRETPRDLAPQQARSRLFSGRPIPWPLFFFLTASILLLALSTAGRRMMATKRARTRRLDDVRGRIRHATTIGELAAELPDFIGAVFGEQPAKRTLHECDLLARKNLEDESLREDLSRYILALERAVYGGDRRSDASAALLEEGRALAGKILNARPSQNRRRDTAIAVLVLAAACTPRAWAETPDEAFQSGRFDDARAAYETELQINGGSSALYFNLANTYFRLHRFGRALVNYERALLLDPGSFETKENLGRTLFQLPSPLADDARTHLDAARFPPPFSALELQGLFLVAWSLGWFFALRRTGHRRTRVVASALSAVLSCFAALGLVRYEEALRSLPAVIVSPETKVFAAATADAEVISVLPEAAMVKTFQTVKGWSRISVTGGRSGWVPVDALELPSKL